jgi:hypothetical protein
MGDWYQDLYAEDPSSDNPFGREALKQTRNPELHAFLQAGGRSILTFPRAPQDGAAARTALSDAVDGALAKMAGAK